MLFQDYRQPNKTNVTTLPPASTNKKCDLHASTWSAVPLEHGPSDCKFAPTDMRSAKTGFNTKKGKERREKIWPNNGGLLSLRMRVRFKSARHPLRVPSKRAIQ